MRTPPNQRPPRPMDPRPPRAPVLEDSFDVHALQDADSFLAAIRKGPNQDKPLEIGLGQFKAPCRLISAAEELRIVVNATIRAKKENINGEKLEVSISYAVMTDVLYEACKVGNSFLPPGFIERLSAKELAALYDQYTDLNYILNPNLQELSTEEILEILDGVKKKTLSVKSLYSYQLRAIGKYFLDVLLPSLLMARDSGST